MDFIADADYVKEDTVIDLNVGGKIFSTFKSTLTKETDSELAAIVNGNSPSKFDNTGRHFIDCDPEIFGYILEYLRIGNLPPQEKVINVYKYAKHLNLNVLQDILEQFKEVQGKINVDNAKRSLDQEKYEVLKREILRTLASSKENTSKYISMVTVDSKSSNLQELRVCYCNQNVLQSNKGQVMYVKALRPAFLTELQTHDINLARAIASDLESFGYGSVRYSMKDVQCLSCCQAYDQRMQPYYKPYNQCLRIVLSERFENYQYSHFQFESV